MVDPISQHETHHLVKTRVRPCLTFLKKFKQSHFIFLKKLETIPFEIDLDQLMLNPKLYA
jgi:hypothetical protein